MTSTVVVSSQTSGWLNWTSGPAHRILVALLLAGLVAATVHLILMLAKHWRDRTLTWHAFIFSLLVHLTCGLGLITVQLNKPSPAALPEEKPIQIESVLIEADEKVAAKRGGNSPVWEQLPELPKQELLRLDRSPPEFAPLELKRRKKDVQQQQPADVVADVVPLVKEPVVRPEPLEVAQLDQQEVQTAPTEKVAEPKAEARPEVQMPVLSVQRRPLVQKGTNQPLPERRTARGSSDVVATDTKFEPLPLSLERSAEPEALLRRATESERVALSRSPAPSQLKDRTVGSEKKPEAVTAPGGTNRLPNFTRLRTPSLFSYENGSLRLLNPQRTARSPHTESRPPVALKSGLPSPAPVEGPKPQLVQPNSQPKREKRIRIPATYRLRNLQQRSQIAQQYGGTEESERAVERSLSWLAAHQDADGHWDADGFMSHCPPNDRCSGPAGRIRKDSEGIDRMNAGLYADTGLTGLALLAFLGAGYTPQRGKYAETVERGLRWLISQQRSDGFLGGRATRYARMYCHAMAAYALAEAYGMRTEFSQNQWLRRPLRLAVQYIVETQNPQDGGWRYVPGQRSDMSMFGWQLMALKSAEIAGLPIPNRTRQLMIKFLKDRSLGKHGGLAAYRVTVPPLPPTPSMTAEALFSKQMLGIHRDHPASLEAVQYLLQHLPKRSEHNLYYWYYGTLAMYQYGGQAWQQWNASLRDLLVEEQRKDGHAAGSWDPLPPWGPFGGRIYSTTLSTLCLETYYRFLPLYRLNSQEFTPTP